MALEMREQASRLLDSEMEVEMPVVAMEGQHQMMYGDQNVPFDVDYTSPKKGDPAPIVFKPVSIVIGIVMTFGWFAFVVWCWFNGGELFEEQWGLTLATAKLMSAQVIFMYVFCGVLFGSFGYCWDPNLFFLAPNMFNAGRDLVFGQKHTFLTYSDHAKMFRAAIASVHDPQNAVNQDKYTNGVAANAMLAITIKLRAECFFWWSIAAVHVLAIFVDFRHRALLHAFDAFFAFNIMCVDLNHWLPASLGIPFPFGWNNHVTGIGRFIGWSLGPLWLPTMINACAGMWFAAQQ
jgi:hypothetical protein